MKYITVLLALALLIIPAFAQDEESETTSIFIAPYTQPCVGVAPQDCLIVRFEDETSLSFFYDAIDGFDFESGYAYELRVNITEIDNPPADASSLNYELVEIVSQIPAEIDGKIWELQTLYGEAIDTPSRYILTISDGELSLLADCNTVLGTITLQPLAIETTISTMAMCSPDSLESAYQSALADANMFSIENGELILQSSDGQLRFAPPTLPENVVWQMTTATVLGEAIDLEDAPYSIEFQGDLALMTVACNRAGADVEVDGASISFGTLETEEELCLVHPLDGIFPPEGSVYGLSPDNQLIMSDLNGNQFTFTQNAE